MHWRIESIAQNRLSTPRHFLTNDSCKIPTMTAIRPVVVKSADRLLDLLEMLIQRRHGLTHAKLSAELGIPKSSLTQLLGNLVERGYLSFKPGPNLYEIGPRLVELVERQAQTMNIPRIAQRFCDQLTRETGESSAFYLPAGDESERICGANSSQSLTFNMRIGETAPLYATSSGKVMLAWMSDDELNAYLSRVELRGFTVKTFTRAAALKKGIEQVRNDGLAWSVEEYTQGIIGLAAPVAQSERKLLGVLNIAYPSARDSPAQRSRLGLALCAAASGLGDALSA
jgi:DNA-binding IclR family transcriptional regulator